jgi:hypothetical protein
VDSVFFSAKLSYLVTAASAIASIFIVYVSIFNKRSSVNQERDIRRKREYNLNKERVDTYNEINRSLKQIKLHKDLPEDVARTIEAVVRQISSLENSKD